MFENFVINGAFLESEIHDRLEAEHGRNIPWAMLIDPTSACNLHCTGCWAAEYGNRLNLTYEELDNIIGQGEELGMHFFLFSGGEPLVRKADILRLCERHSDCQFSAFTNGTLIDEAFADEMLRVKNFIPAISVEGFEADTNFRRGEGTFRQVERAIAILKQKRLPFGISCCYTSKNVEMIGSEVYFDQMIAWGAKFCWFFTYMPVGNAAVPELMVTPEQRRFMYEQVRKFRRTKPLFTMNFWNDGEYAGGCVAGGRRYLHINAGGGTCTSTRAATWSPAPSCITPTPTSGTRPSWRPSSPRCSWPTMTASPSTATICSPAPCWTTRTGCAAWCIAPARTPPTWRAPRMWTA